MVVQHNMTAQNANRMLGITTGELAKSTEKLSSGYKVNRAADDASGLSISEKMRKQIRGLTQASANAQDGISMVQTAEGALTEVHSMLQRMNELSVKAANGTLSSADRGNVQDELDQLTSEINRVSTTTKFNELYLLSGTNQNGSATGGVLGVSLQVGADPLNSNKISVGITAMNSKTLFGSTALNVKDSTGALASSVISTIGDAISIVSKQRSALGAVQNRLEHTIKNLDNIVENTTSAESEIRDTDMASEMVVYSKNNILQQAGQSMLAQANQANQGVLSLLG
ncbi:flagellin [Lachnospiraceae bacterium]|nr:flagellin [Lachnospiraceae bacterium]